MIWVKLIKKASPSLPCVKEFVNNCGNTEDEASKSLIYSKVKKVLCFHFISLLRFLYIPLSEIKNFNLH